MAMLKMRIISFLAAAAFASIVSGQSQCESSCAPTSTPDDGEFPCQSTNPPSWCPPPDPCELPNPPSECFEPDPCLGDNPPEYCGPPSGDPCEGPDPPWFCPGQGIFDEPFSFVEDGATGFRFSQYKAVYTLEEKRIVYRIARPEVVPEGKPFDVVVQLQAPVEVGWMGLAWGGTMLNNPLTVAWANCSNVVVSSRWASSRAQPQPYAGATYEILEQGTIINATHYQVTAKCVGCTSWEDPVEGRKTIDAHGIPELAWAYAIQEPLNPANITSDFNYHDAHGVWNNNLTENGNSGFEDLVALNRAAATPVQLPPDGKCLYTKPETTDGRVTVTKTETQTQTVTEAATTVTVTEAATTVTVGTVTATVQTVTLTNCPVATNPSRRF